MPSDTPVWELLKGLRKRAGYSRAGIADAMGIKETTFLTYDSQVFKKQYLPMDLVEKLIPVLVGRGSPPIAKFEVAALGGGETAADSGSSPEERSGAEQLGHFDKKRGDLTVVALFNKLPKEGQVALLSMGSALLTAYQADPSELNDLTGTGD